MHGNEDADTINGNEGNDLLFGGSGNDTIKGQLGDDIIEGGEDRDFLFGGSGNDDINGDGGGDEISGGVGNDTLIGGEGADTIFGNEENLQELSADETDDDLILAGDDSDSVFGNQGDDTIDGEAGNDLILSGGDGDDTVYGGDGDDVIAGDAGFDELFGEDHDDVIDGGDQDDTIRGGGGDDQISGNNGNDLLFGDADDDSIRGGLGHDEIDGGAGNDYLVGNRGHDDIYGNYGDDVVEGNEGDDRLRGNEGHDLMYGDDGRDDMAGGPGNDTMRGGRDVDIMRGGDGDDLILGHTGSDELFGDGGNDVIKGFTGNDTIDGGDGNDRVDGQDGEDAIDGGAGDDLLRGGSGNDTVDGGDGDDQLHGDQGVDVLLGGDDDDFLIAGNGIGNRLAGGDGDDHLVGSDDGSDDPDFSDAIPFGDILIGGRGDDTIEGLGGADVIDAGLGNDLVWGGNHGDQIVSGFATPWPAADDDTVYGGAGDDRIDDAAGTNLLDGNEGADTINGGAVAVPPVPAPSPAFSMSVGIEVDGYWEELSDSATKDGLTQVGGFEEAVYADDSGVYVAWVDWRNGNSEIYLAYHNDGSGDWIELGASASGGGISNDPQQSRRPTIAKAGDELLVAWTSIDENGNTNIETALQSLNWGRRSTTGQTGKADHAQLVSYNGDSALLAWIDTTSGTPRVYLDQYAQTACVQNYLSTKVAVYPQMFSTAQVDDFDLGTLQHQAAVAISHSGGDDNDVEVWYSRIANLYDETVLCTGVNPPNVELHAPGIWEQIGSFQEGHNVEPAVAILLTDSNGPNEIATEVYVAWHGITDREDQIHAQVREFGFFQSRDWEVIEPQALGGEPRDVATISDTIGYAAIPDLDANGNAVFLAWMDDGVHQDFSTDSSAYVMVANAGTPVFFERVEHDASGGGISDTGGAMLSLSMEVAAESDAPYVVWTEAKPGKPQLYLRHDLNVEHPTKPPGDPDSGGDKPPVVDRRWQNKINRFDVNDDGRVSTLDALIVINELGRRPSGPLPQNEVPRYFFDSSGDGNLSPLDALRVINEIARRLSRAAVIPDNPDQPPVDVPTIESLDPVDVDRVFATGMDEEERFGEFDVELPSRLF